MEIRGIDISSSVKDSDNEAVFFPPHKANWFLYKLTVHCGFILENLSQFVQ